jgi:hypothetical protein
MANGRRNKQIKHYGAAELGWHCCIWRPLKPASSTRVPERHRRCPRLTALSTSGSRLDGSGSTLLPANRTFGPDATVPPALLVASSPAAVAATSRSLPRSRSPSASRSPTRRAPTRSPIWSSLGSRRYGCMAPRTGSCRSTRASLC